MIDMTDFDFLTILAGMLSIIFSTFLYFRSRVERQPFEVGLFSRETMLLISILSFMVGVAFIAFGFGFRVSQAPFGNKKIY